MPKAYWIAHVDVADPEAYKAYVAANAEPFKRFGAKFLARGGAAEQLEGSGRARNVIIEFKDLETARACYASPEYQHAKSLRTPVSTADVTIVEGYAGLQPGEA
jgi:uncharacterized protein (DUF1330 family)